MIPLTWHLRVAKRDGYLWEVDCVDSDPPAFPPMRLWRWWFHRARCR